MGISKRRKEEIRKWIENERLHPSPSPPPSPPWTLDQLKALDRMEEVLRTLVYGQAHDINALFEFLRFEHLFQGVSLRMMDLRRKANHYSELEQPAAKAKLWEKMSQILYGLLTEVSRLRHSRERGGTGDQ